MLIITCPACGRELRAQEQYAGRRVQCPQCGTISQLPVGEVPAPMASVVCALCSRGIVDGEDCVVDTNEQYYHRSCYDEACRRVRPHHASSAPPAVPSVSSPSMHNPHSGPPLGLLVGLGAAIPAGVLLLIVIQVLLSSGPPRNQAPAEPAIPSQQHSPTAESPAAGTPLIDSSAAGSVVESGPPRGAQTSRRGFDDDGLCTARIAFRTKLRRLNLAQEPAPMPPANLFRMVRYDSSAGKLVAYLTPDPKDGRQHPAIIWITGGDCNSIGECWEPAPASNDQSVPAFRQAGIVMMFPSLRGGNDNPGVREGFFGEIDDVLAASDYLMQQSYVDPRRVYLGGHSTGGTIVLLVAECSARFRAVFSFGPVQNLADYPPKFLPFDTSNPRELEIRSPIHWLHSIASPVFVFGGTEDDLVPDIRKMARAASNPAIRFCSVPRADHFNLLTPITRLIATKILCDEGSLTNITFTEQELNCHLPR